MATTVTCPTLSDFLNKENCLENIAGTSNVCYIGLKGDLSEAMTRTDNVYSTPKFASGKGLYKIELKDSTQGVQGASQGNNKGFNLTYEATIDRVNKDASKLARALNNLDYFLIVPDGDDSQIIYDPNKRVKADSDGISSDTGKAAGDDRQITLSFTLEGVLYPNLYVTAPDTGGWDSLLASAAAS